MRFPAWVEGPRMTKAQRATARLRFIIKHLALHHTGRSSMRALATKVGLDHSTLAMYCRQGSFSTTAADKIVAALGVKAIRKTDLTDPLSIKA